MTVEIVIPKLGMTMTEGTLVAWLVADGSRVSIDEPLFHLTTDKLDHDEVAPTEGVLRRVVEASESALECGTLIGYLLSRDEAGLLPGTAARLVASPAAKALARLRSVDLAGLRGSGPDGRIVLADVPVAASAAAGSAAVGSAAVGSAALDSTAAGSDRVAVTPLARKLADEHGVDLGAVTGTGPGGRITKEDVLAATATNPDAATAAPSPASATAHAVAVAPASPTAPAPAPALDAPVPTALGSSPAVNVASGQATASTGAAEHAVTGMRKVIAERMHASLQQMAQLTLTTEAAVDDLVALRTQLVSEWAEEGVKPSYTDLVMKAAAKALRKHPGANAEFRTSDTGAAIIWVPEIHVGMAVALGPHEGGAGPLGGLIVATTCHTETTSLHDLAATTAALAAKARAGKLTLDEMTGATFTVTALGSQGVDAFTPVVNPPNVAILGIGRIKDSVGWDGERPVKRQILTLSLSFDHRAIDGAPAAEFLKSVRELLEAPFRLLV